ncbi:NADAR family protein [Sphingobacterium faecale]|uniref:NADAR family protein n=1 Tax=Sphingobacterium faecale TaxID=2803775 RepID=A0ABS1R1Y8_9SPHI|nr:NADAR family protein [Sphingobacterium faecale]MBL1408711.1 NADAR family protein [Sphingobacterium faecale]
MAISKRNIRIYNRNEVITFSKTNEAFGELSNMSSSFPLFVNDIIVPSSEALYQAMRYSLFPKAQNEIIRQASPMTAKMISKKYNPYSRQDWELIKLKVMRWVMEIKLSQHWNKLAPILEETGNKAIVELSYKDQFWGAKNIGNNQLEGKNALGRLWMDLREKHVLTNNKIECVAPLAIAGFRLYDHDIDTICDEDHFLNNEEEGQLFAVV